MHQLKNITKSNPEIVAAVIDKMVDIFYEHRDLVRVAREQLPASDHFQALRENQQDVTSLLAMFMRLRDPKKDQDPDVAAFVSFTAVDGIIMGWLTAPEPPFPLERLKAEIISLAKTYLDLESVPISG